MRALALTVILLVVSRAEARADCFGGSFGPRGPTARGRITEIRWGAPSVVTCRGQSRCLEAVLASASALTHVRLVIENVEYRDGRGASYKLARVVLDGILPRRIAECQPAVIAVGQIRELDVEPRTSAPWRVTSAR